jgi:hypothetical protein
VRVGRIIRGSVEKARERRSGEILVKALFERPGRVEAQGSFPTAMVLNPPLDDRVSWQGEDPGTAACRAGPLLRLVGTTAGETVRGFIRSGNVSDTWQEDKLRRANPKSAGGVKQNRPGIEGSKPSRG